jgi:hypothetical protein
MSEGMRFPLAAVLAACAACATAGTPSAPASPPQQVEVQVDREDIDPCEERRRYGDGVCDEFCPEVDPDCDPRVCMVTPLRARR